MSKTINEQIKDLKTLETNYKGKVLKEIESGNYVKLFTVEASWGYKASNVLFQLTDTQGGKRAVTYNLTVRYGASGSTVQVYNLNGLPWRLNSTESVSDVIAVVTSNTTVELYCKVSSGNQSPTLNIICTSIYSESGRSDVGATITIDMDTIVSTIPEGTQTIASSLI